MMKRLCLGSLVTVACAKDLKLSWKDCGDADTKVKVSSFTPASLTLGQKATMTGTGPLSEDVTGASFDLEMTGSIGHLLSCTGDASQSKTCALPLGTGSLTFDALTFPIKAGPASVSVDIQISANLPSSLANTVTTATAKTSTGDKLFCIQITTSPEELAVHPDRAAMIKEIESTPGVLWKAAPHPRFASQAPGASKDLCGVIGDQNKIIADLVKAGEIDAFEESANAALPDSFDSEQNWPHCAKIIGDIRDQSNCGCCWAFAGAEAASDRMCIATNASIMVPLSAQDVCFNGGGIFSQGCDGGQITSPWSFIGGKGAVSGGQYQGSGPFGKGLCSDFSLPHCHHHGPQGSDPYPAEGAPGCPSQSSPAGPRKCDADAVAPHNDFAADKYSFKGRTITASGETGIQQAIMAGGPMEVAFSVYADFENYVSGIYHHVTGSQVGGHAVKVVGWGVEGGVKYWKIANSWNPYWGEKGYFRIRRGNNEGGIEDQAVASSPSAKWSKHGDVLAQEEQVQGGTLKLTWSDCGDSSYHGKVKSLSPDSLTLGQKTTITGSGTVDESVTGGSFTITAKAGIITEHYNGDACAPKTFSLPLGLGTVTWDGLKCPVAKGDVSVSVDVQLSGAIPSSMAKCTISLQAKGASSENLLCMNLQTAPEAAAIVV